jgi:hypothetical protein
MVFYEAEVEQLGAAPRDHHIRRLEVAMHEAGAMGGVQRVSNVDRDGQCLDEWQRSTREARR